MMTVDSIYKSFSLTKLEYSGEICAIRIDDGSNTAWSYRDDKSYGIMIPMTDRISIEIDELFSGVRLRTLQVNDIEHLTSNKVLVLSASDESSRKQFSSVCYDFACHENRRALEDDPISWWKSWKKLLGNYEKSYEPYSLLGEMIVADWLLTHGEEIEWNKQKTFSTMDIVSSSKRIGHEVKSTITRYGNVIHISGQFQMTSEMEKAYLYFLRFEEIGSGSLSIDEVRNSLIKHGYSALEIDLKLEASNFSSGRVDRKTRYNLLEFRRYQISEGFPLIKDSCFVNNALPNGIIHIEYDVDLSNIENDLLTYHS